MLDINLTELKHFPFQTQIYYTALDGSKCLRVITQLKEVSTDRQELEKKANFNIMSTNAIQQSSKIARAGDLRGAQSIAKGWNRKMRNNI